VPSWPGLSGRVGRCAAAAEDPTAWMLAEHHDFRLGMYIFF